MNACGCRFLCRISNCRPLNYLGFGARRGTFCPTYLSSVKPMQLTCTVTCVAVVLLAGATAGAQQPEPAGQHTSTEYLRINYDESNEPVALQSAIVSYRLSDKQRKAINVDLVGALHVADQSYYAELNRLFKRYDSVLYELIADEGTRVPSGGPQKPGTIASTQVAIKNALGLSFQLEEIDYSADNFVHADMSPEQVSASMSARNETLYQYFWKIFFFATREYARDPLGTRGLDLYSAFFAADQERALKIELAKELLNVDYVTQSLEGPDGSTLIGERNKQALKILGERIAAGDRHIAIFYGAGHLSDLHQRMTNELNLQRAEFRWLDAWDLRPAQ
jgi:hypothetical protein